MANLTDNQKALLTTILIVVMFAYVSTSDYEDARQIECYKQGHGYNAKTDKCEGER
jgi:hypothetical protein